jgi:hypothetical protein
VNVVARPEVPAPPTKTFIIGTSCGVAEGSLDPSKPTVVLTHGWQDEPYNTGSVEKLWTGYSSENGREGMGYLINKQLGCSVNVIQVVWPAAFQKDNYGTARQYTDDAGNALATYLLAHLGKTYNKPIHFVGHSLGTIVNTYASHQFLASLNNVPDSQITILDFPNRVPMIYGGDFSQNFFAVMLQELQQKNPGHVMIDNYFTPSITGFGNPIAGIVYNHIPLEAPDDVGSEILSGEGNSKDHSGVHQWYRWTVQPEGFNTKNYCDNTDPSKFISPLFVGDSLDPCQEGWYWSLNGDGGSVQAANSPELSITSSIRWDAVPPQGLNYQTSGNCTFSNGTITCRENSSPYIILEDVEIPNGSKYMSFDYRFLNVGDGDYMSVMVDGEPIWTLSNDSAFNPSEFTNSGIIALPQILKKGPHKIIISLFGVGEHNAEFELKNIQFVNIEADNPANFDERIAPVTTSEVFGTHDKDGSYTGPITVALMATDNDGGIGIEKTMYSVDNGDWQTYFAENPVKILTHGVHTLQYYSADLFGNTEEVKSENFTLLIDDIVPITISALSGTFGTNGWYKSSVSIALNATDNDGGVGVEKTLYALDGSEFQLYSSASPIPVSSDGVHTLQFYSVDWFGNIEATQTINFKIDKTLPMVSLVTPINGVEYLLNQSVTADWLASDDGSGLLSAVGTTASGSAIDTSTVGEKSYTITATDNAGNVTVKTVKYRVVYNYGGILQPVNVNGSSIFKLGSTVPMKFQLKDADGIIVNSAIVNIFLSKLNGTVAGTELEAVSISAASTGNQFRYSTDGSQYIFNLSTKLLSTGTWQVRIALDDGTSKFVNIALK